MAGAIHGSVTLHVEVLDEQAMWDHAFGVYAGGQSDQKFDKPGEAIGPGAELHDQFVAICGSRADPDIVECLRMIFDPGESPPGTLIDDSSAEVHPPAWDEKYTHFIGDRGELGTDGFGGGHD